MKGFFFIFFSFSLLSLSAQVPLKRSSRFGVKSGIDFTQIEGAQHGPLRVGFAGGIWLQMKVKKKLTAQLEILFAEKGTGGKRHGFYSLTLYYFEVPILLQYHFKNSIFEIGPGLGYLSQAGGSVQSESIYDRKEFSMNAGIVWVFDDSWNFGWRYTNSIVPVRTATLAENRWWPGHLYNCVFAFTLAHQLKAKKPKVRAEPLIIIEEE